MAKKHKVPMLVIVHGRIKDQEYRFEETVAGNINENEVEHIARRQVLVRFLARRLRVKKIVIEHAGT
jgi:hypothetical protein